MTISRRFELSMSLENGGLQRPRERLPKQASAARHFHFDLARFSRFIAKRVRDLALFAIVLSAP